MFDTNEQKYAEYTVITDLHTLLANRFNPKISGNVCLYQKAIFYVHDFFLFQIH